MNASDRTAVAETGLAGTVDYVAPEQIRGEPVDGRADVYALGCLLFECLVGRPPFHASSEVATIYAHLEEEPPSASTERPELPKAIDPVLTKALAKTPSERHASCRELIGEARAALGIAEPRRSRWPAAVAALGVVLIGAALLAYFLGRGSGGAPIEKGADTLVRIDPATNKPTKTIAVGRESSAVASGAGFVWVTSYGDGTVWRIDPKTGETATFPVQGSPSGVAALPAPPWSSTAREATAWSPSTRRREPSGESHRFPAIRRRLPSLPATGRASGSQTPRNASSHRPQQR